MPLLQYTRPGGALVLLLIQFISPAIDDTVDRRGLPAGLAQARPASS